MTTRLEEQEKQLQAKFARMERELSAHFGGRKMDLRTAEDLSRYFRAKVLATAEVQFGERR
jgi:predicted nucleotidyltransferase